MRERRLLDGQERPHLVAGRAHDAHRRGEQEQREPGGGGEGRGGGHHEERAHHQHAPAAEPVGAGGDPERERGVPEQREAEEQPDPHLVEAGGRQVQHQHHGEEAVREEPHGPRGEEEPDVPAKRAAHGARSAGGGGAGAARPSPPRLGDVQPREGQRDREGAAGDGGHRPEDDPERALQRAGEAGHHPGVEQAPLRPEQPLGHLGGRAAPRQRVGEDAAQDADRQRPADGPEEHGARGGHPAAAPGHARLHGDDERGVGEPHADAVGEGERLHGAERRARVEQQRHRGPRGARSRAGRRAPARGSRCAG